MKRIYVSLICLIVSVLAINQTFSQGINFRQDDWQNVLMQAKAQKKLILTEIYSLRKGLIYSQHTDNQTD